MKKILKHISIVGLILIGINNSYAFDISDFKGIFFKRSDSTSTTTATGTANINIFTLDNLEDKSTVTATTTASTTSIINIIIPIVATTTPTTTIDVVVNSTTTVSTSTKKDLGTEILKGDKCEVKKVKLNNKKDKVIKNLKSQIDDTAKVADVVNKVIEKLDTTATSDIQISADLTLKLNGFAKEVNDATQKENQMINLIASTTELSCINKNFDKNLSKINKLDAETNIQLNEAKDYLQTNVKGALKEIN